MHLEYYIDLLDDSGPIGMTAHRRLICGEVVDRVILENRIKPAPNLLYGTKPRKFAQRIDETESDEPARDDDGED